MARSDKVAAVAELVERFRASDAVLLTEYRGLTVGQLKQLRRGLGENASYAVVKNTLASASSLRTSRGRPLLLSSPVSLLRLPRRCVILPRKPPSSS